MAAAESGSRFLICPEQARHRLREGGGQALGTARPPGLQPNADDEAGGRAAEVLSPYVGQVPGQMKAVKHAGQVLLDLADEFVDGWERVSDLVADCRQSERTHFASVALANNSMARIFLFRHAAHSITAHRRIAEVA